MASQWVTFRVHIATTDVTGKHVRRESIDCSESIEKLRLSRDDGKGRLKVGEAAGMGTQQSFEATKPWILA